MSISSRTLFAPLGGPVVSLLLLVAVTALAAWGGAVASISAQDFYGALAKPEWAPSPKVFGPVWTVLYLCMAVAAWMVWRTGGPEVARVPLLLYLVQLLLNSLWTWIFFRWHAGGWALVEIALLWVVLLVTIMSFWRVRAAAGMLLLPYLAWVSFATALTAAIWRRNPGVL